MLQSQNNSPTITPETVRNKVQELNQKCISVPEFLNQFEDNLEEILDQLATISDLGYIDAELFRIGWIKIAINGKQIHH